MTRGKLVLFWDNKIYASTEFNGDQYPEGLGSESYALMKDVKDLASFKKAVKIMNRHYGYEEVDDPTEEGVYLYADFDANSDEYEAHLDFAKNYFEHWSSDYLYIKNAENEAVAITVKEESEYFTRPADIDIQPGQTICLNYGRPVPSTKFDDVA